MKLETIIENQREILTYVRQNSGKDATGDALEELFTRPLDSAEEMDELCLKLMGANHNKILVCANICVHLYRKCGL
jgi:hypothetical protein